MRLQSQPNGQSAVQYLVQISPPSLEGTQKPLWQSRLSLQAQPKAPGSISQLATVSPSATSGSPSATSGSASAVSFLLAKDDVEDIGRTRTSRPRRRPRRPGACRHARTGALMR
jgi:hypothetical protein